MTTKMDSQAKPDRSAGGMPLAIIVTDEAEAELVARGRRQIAAWARRFRQGLPLAAETETAAAP